MTAAADQGHGVGEPLAVTAPELDSRRGALHPALIRLMQKDRNTAQRLAPFHHRGIEMRMRDDDTVDAAFGLQRGDSLISHQAQAFPQDVAGIGRQEEGSLINGKARIEADAEDTCLIRQTKTVTT